MTLEAQTKAPDRAPAAARMIATFLAGDAAQLSEEHMVRENVTPAEDAARDKLAGMDLYPGFFTRVLFCDRARDVSLVYAWFKSNFMLPRHSHNAECFYYVVSGAITFGDQTLAAGDSFFVPNDAKYSYQAGPDGVEILEFRTSTKFNYVGANSETAWTKIMANWLGNSEAWKAEAPPPAAARMGAKAGQ